MKVRMPTPLDRLPWCECPHAPGRLPVFPIRDPFSFIRDRNTHPIFVRNCIGPFEEAWRMGEHTCGQGSCHAS